MLTEIWTDKKDLRNTRVVEADLPELADGEILVSIDKFALTSNNVSYALSGDDLGYWQFFPTDDNSWGKGCVWGMATVVGSTCADIDVGEQLYGFLPMSSHLVLKPAKVTPTAFFDATSYRRDLPALYNQYQRCSAEPSMMKTLEDERCVLFPLFMTGFIIADFLADNAWFDAEQIVFGSVSSKTGFSAAAFVRSMGYEGRIVGLTSPGNVEFVTALGVCDRIVAYDDAASIENVPSVFMDMSGNADLRRQIHTLLAENIVSSQMVGATHWDAYAEAETLPGAKPVLFFTPHQAQKRAKEWGAAKLMQKNFTASAQLAFKFKDVLQIEHHAGMEAAVSIWNDILDNKISGKRGIMIMPEG